MEGGFDIHMDEVVISSDKANTTAIVNFKDERKILRQEVEAQKRCIIDMEDEFTSLLAKERQANKKSLDEKCAMIRELTQEVYKVVKENNTLKTEIKSVIQESARQREEHMYFIKQHTKKEKEAFSCFSAALQAKNHVLGKLIKQLETTKAQLAQAKKIMQAQKLEYKVKLEISEEKRKQSLSLKDEEILHLKEKIERKSSSSTPPDSPVDPTTPNNIFEKKRELLQKQVEEMCRILDSQNEDNAIYCNEIESSIAKMNEQNFQLKSEVLRLQKEVEKRDEMLKIQAAKEEQILNNKKIVSKEVTMEVIRQNMVLLIKFSERDTSSEKDMVKFLRDMRKILREVRRRVLTGTDSDFEEKDGSTKMKENIEDKVMKMGKKVNDIPESEGTSILSPKNVIKELSMLDAVYTELSDLSMKCKNCSTIE